MQFDKFPNSNQYCHIYRGKSVIIIASHDSWILTCMSSFMSLIPFLCLAAYTNY